MIWGNMSDCTVSNLNNNTDTDLVVDTAMVWVYTDDPIETDVVLCEVDDVPVVEVFPVLVLVLVLVAIEAVAVPVRH